MGWIRAPEPLVARITRFKAVLDLGESLPGQILAAHLLRDAHRARVERREEITARFALLYRLLGDLLPSWSWVPPKGHLSLWVRLPSGSARELAVLAGRKGVAVLPGSVMSPDLSFDGHLRLTSARESAVLEEGMRRLASAWQEYAPGGARQPGTLEVIV